jgi:hypothetical protein
MQTNVQVEEPRKASFFVRVIEAPSIEVAKFTLSSYTRSGWLVLDVVFILAIFGLFFSAQISSSAFFLTFTYPILVWLLRRH